MNKYLPFFLLGAACSDVKSSSINTSGIYAEISATVDAVDETTVNVIFRVGDANSNTFVELDEGDSLEASDGATSEVLQHSSFASIHSYSKTFETTAAGTEFTIDFKRELETAAPASTAILPPGFSLLSPETGASHSQQEDLVVTWEGEAGDADTMSIEVSGTCIFSIADEVPFEDNAYTIDSSGFEKIGSDETVDNCEVEIILQRKKNGTLDPAYGDGEIFGAVRQIQTIRLTP